MATLRTLVRVLVVLAAVAASGAFLRRPRGLKHTKPEFWMDSVQLARLQGYAMDMHRFFTSDGYEVALHHIVASKNGTLGGVPVLLGHGLASCDEQWLARGATALVYMLVELGFDVWTVNYRGSFYSRGHKTLTSRHHDYWDFSWHENGVVDQAEAIDYVLQATGRQKLVVIGHSMSSTAQVVLLAERPEYNDKVMGQVLLAPPVNFEHSTGALAYAGKVLLNLPGMKESGTENVQNDVFSGFEKPFPQSCYPDHSGVNPKLFPFCQRLIEFVLGKVHEPVDPYQMQMILHHYPAGSSIRQIRHFSQCIAAGKFMQYDYGKARNQALYGQDLPPEYNLTNIRTPTYLMYALGDGSVNWKDVEIFGKLLSPGVLRKLHRLPPKDYCHVDFLIARDAVELVYVPVIKYLEELRSGAS
ncbi:lipase 1-like [Thrips palmi]|uniref:Lipase n=1 Tax=Thrips palmi TaxID=161013 RepID=A0A6P8ZM82_THRPL|nr:lipase 1-like [Thrips palmi]